MMSDSLKPIPIPPSINLDNLRNTPKHHRLIDTPLAQILQILGIFIVLLLFILKIFIVITDNLIQREAALTKLDRYISEEKPSHKVFLWYHLSNFKKKLESEAITVINDQYNAFIRTGINTLKDFIQRFLEIYLQARRESRNSLISELFIKINHRVKKSFFENFTQDVRDLGQTYWTDIDGFNIDEYLTTFGIRETVRPQEILPKIQRLESQETGLIELAHYIMVLDLYKDFTCHQDIISKLIKSNNMVLLGYYIKGEIDLQKVAVNSLVKNKNIPKAVDYIKTFDLDPEDFPHLLHTLKKNAIRYHQSQSDWMAIEERFSNSPKYLALYIEELIKTNQIDIALSIVRRHQLLEQEGVLSLKIQSKIAKKEFEYKENKLFLVDGYTATEELLGEAESGKYLNLKEWGIDLEKDVIFIDDCETEIFEEAVKDLLGSKEVGLDSEFKLSLSKFDESDVALFQLATHKKIYLFDCPKLKGGPKYIDFIQNLMSDYKIAKVGHTLTMDLRKLEEGLGSDKELVIRNRVDISSLFLTMYFETKSALAYITNYLLKRPMSKYEQMSNWNKRPLRKSQIHYAAFDAFILLKIYDIMKDTIIKNNQGYIPDKFQEKEEIKENQRERKMEVEEKCISESQQKRPNNGETTLYSKIEEQEPQRTVNVIKSDFQIVVERP